MEKQPEAVIQRWHDFVSGCAGDGCCNMKLDIRWKHMGCGGLQKINYDADIRCLKCNICSCITNWKFNCKEGEDEPHQLDVNRLTWALSVALVVAAQKGDKVWARMFNKKLRELLKDDMLT